MSFVAETLVDELGKVVPDPTALDAYAARAQALDSDPDAERARGEACVAWAREVTEEGARSAVGRLAARVRETAEEVEQAVDAFLLAVEGPLSRYFANVGDQLPDGFRLQLNRSFAAVRTAERLAGDVGWDKVPWRDLLDRVFAAG